MRPEFLSAFREILAPLLRADGFKGSGQKHRRTLFPVMQALVLQASRGGDSACVELGTHLTFLPDSIGRSADPAKFDAYSCEFRLRLVPPGADDFWWDYGSTASEARASVGHLVEVYAEVGRPYLARWSRFPGEFIKVAPEMIGGPDRCGPSGRVTGPKAALTFARIALHAGDVERARGFIDAGLSVVGSAHGLRYDLERLLEGVAGPEGAA